jgi:hypothetical protein
MKLELEIPVGIRISFDFTGGNFFIYFLGVRVEHFSLELRFVKVRLKFKCKIKVEIYLPLIRTNLRVKKKVFNVKYLNLKPSTMMNTPTHIFFMTDKKSPGRNVCVLNRRRLNEWFHESLVDT